MPAKDSILLVPNRVSVLSKDLHKRFIKESGIDIDWVTFKKIIVDSNDVITDCILEDPSGFKMPNQLGYLCTIQYKTDKPPPDYFNSAKYDKELPHRNLHSFGRIAFIKWFQVNNSRKNSIYPWKYHPYRGLNRRLAQKVFSGKQYNHFTNSDFWAKSKMERTYYKYADVFS